MKLGAGGLGGGGEGATITIHCNANIKQTFILLISKFQIQLYASILKAWIYRCLDFDVTVQWYKDKRIIKSNDSNQTHTGRTFFLFCQVNKLYYIFI